MLEMGTPRTVGAQHLNALTVGSGVPSRGLSYGLPLCRGEMVVSAGEDAGWEGSATPKKASHYRFALRLVDEKEKLPNILWFSARCLPLDRVCSWIRAPSKPLMDVALRALLLMTNDWSGVLARSCGLGKSQPADPILEQSES
jgi:hypothetical protein